MRLAQILLALAALPGATLAITVTIDTPTAPQIAIDDAATFYDAGDILPEGRIGADGFAPLRAALAARRYDEAVALANALLESEPRAGLGYEVIGTAHFARGRFSDAMVAFERAARIEPGVASNWAKLGILQMEAGELEAAEQSLQAALERDADHRIAHQRLGLLYDYHGDAARAVVHYQRGLEGVPADYVGIAVPLARLLLELDRPEQAIATLAKRVPFESDAVVGHRVLARAYIDSNQPELARQRLARLVQLEPGQRNNALGIAVVERMAGRASVSLDLLDGLTRAYPKWEVAHAERGETLLVLGRDAEALEAFRAANPQGLSGHAAEMRMAQHYIDRDELVRASEYLQTAIEQQTTDPNIYARYSEVLLARGLRDRGRNVLEAAAERFPDSAYIHLRLGSYHAALGDYATAIVSLEKAVNLDADNPTGYVALSLAQSRAGHTAAAAATARELYERHPGQGGYARLYAMRLESDGQSDAAIGAYREALNANADDALSLNNLANLLSDKGEHEEALRLARRATELAPDNGRVVDTYGWALFRAGKTDEARRVLARAVELAPDAGVVLYHHGVALAQAGQREQAAAALRRAIEIAGTADWLSDANERLRQL